MKHILHRSLAVAAWCGFTGSLLADLPYAWHPQPDLSVSNAAADTWHADWQGVTARTYLMQWSLDMKDWQYFPVIREGAGEKSYGFTSSNEAFFLRLEYNDEIPALGDPDGWQPAVLAIAGQWKVVTRDANGNPLPGVNLAFHRWPDGAPTPLATPHHHAVTTNDGTYLFDPLSLSPGDRVEVRMTRDPGQRIHLPWQPGNDNPGNEITPGGQGITPGPMPAGRGTGQTPLPPDQPPSGNPNRPVYRLHDFLLMDFDSSVRRLVRFPSDFHTVTQHIYDGAAGEPEVTEHDFGTGVMPYHLAEYPDEFNPPDSPPSYHELSYNRHLVLGPVPAYVPLSVMSGEPFFYSGIDGPDDDEAEEGTPKSVRLHAELPLGCSLESIFISDPLDGGRVVPAKILWSAELDGPADLQMTLHTGNRDTPAPGTSLQLEAAPNEAPVMWVEFVNTAVPEHPVQSAFSVTRAASETIWTDAFGTHPSESVTLPFGPGWSGNLAASVERVSHVGPDGNADAPGDPHHPRSLLGRLTVRDYQGKPFTFLEYRDASGETSLLPAPTLLPDPAHEGISLETGENNTLILRQPALGMQHVYHATGIDFMVAKNRDVPATGGHHPSGFSRHQYHRLASVTDRFGVTLDYTFHTEADPRPVEMLRPRAGGGHYRIPTHHYALDHIENGRGDAIIIHYHQSDVRKAWSDAAATHYPVAGDPLMVGEIHLPGNRMVEIDYQHVLQNAAPGHAAEHTLVTEVTTIWGDAWRYQFTDPETLSWHVDAADADHLPSAGALVFGKLTRSCADIADSEVTFTYCPAAGFATTQTLDAAARSSQATFEEPFPAPNPFYQAPEISPGLTLFSRHRLPTTTTNRLGHPTHYQYIDNPGAPDHLRIDTITDHRERAIIHGYGTLARIESIHIEQDETTLARIEYGYTNTDIPGAITRVSRKAIASSDDPSWVADLVTDIRLDANGFPDRIGNDLENLHTHYHYSPSGRLLETTAPNGGTRSHQYDSAGLHQSTHLENGAVLRNWRDDAGHVVFRRDALGHATGLERDGLGRVTRTVRDMNGTLGFLPVGTLTGVDPEHDIITTTAYLDTEREIRTTDPRGFITIHRFDALGRTTRIIAPGNQRAPATLPTEQEDRLTTFDYDILESPSHPVKSTDPLGHDTHFLFDAFARLEMVLREYGQDPATTAPLHSGTATTYHPDTGLPATTTAIRTPLDQDGEPIGQAAIESLTTRILRDALDRPQTVIHADGTDKELHHTVHHTSTGIPHRWRTRLAPAHGQTPEQWSTWEIECDALGRTIKHIAPAIIESTTQQPVTPTTGYHYGPDGLLHQTTDSFDHTTTYGHDILGLPAWVRQPAVFDAKSGQEIHPHTAWHRDANGHVTRVIDPLGYAWTHQRDAAGRVTTSTGPVVHPHATGGEHRRRPVWHRTYDAAGNPDTVTDAEGRVRTFDYYPDGHLESTTIPVTFINEIGDGEILPVTEQYHRDELGRVTRETLLGHDLAGNLVREDMPSSLFQETGHDPLGRVTSRRVRHGDGHTLCKILYQYDLLANVTRIEEAAAHTSVVTRVIENTYNELNQLVTETTTRTGGTLGSAIHTRHTLHRHDAAENRLSSAITNFIDSTPSATLLREFQYGTSAITSHIGGGVAGRLHTHHPPNPRRHQRHRIRQHHKQRPPPGFRPARSLARHRRSRHPVRGSDPTARPASRSQPRYHRRHHQFARSRKSGSSVALRTPCGSWLAVPSLPHIIEIMSQ